MKLYIAAKYPVERDVKDVIAKLEAAGFEFPMPWWKADWEPITPAAHWELTDQMLRAIRESDALVIIPPDAGGVGSFIETGYAMGLGKDVFRIRYTSTHTGDRQAKTHDRHSSFFHNEDFITTVLVRDLVDALDLA